MRLRQEKEEEVTSRFEEMKTSLQGQREGEQNFEPAVYLLKVT
jgi:hypothetical protein